MSATEQTPEVIDIGVNLAHRSFHADLDKVIQRAFAAGVRTMVITGTSVAGSQEGVRIAREYPRRVFATAGVHPHDSRHCTLGTIPELRRLAELEKVVAIGECGLDFNRDFSPRPDQEKWFEAQVALAEELQLPLFLHERDAQERFCQILAGTRKSVPAVLHCFTGTGEELNAYLEMGLHIGITGWICDERRGTHLRELVKRIPLDRLMIETDAPFLVPRSMPKRPKDGRNEPAFLPYVLQTVAECLGKTPAEVAEATTKTAREFFRLRASDLRPPPP
jgi:TatD DNase family protein